MATREAALARHRLLSKPLGYPTIHVVQADLAGLPLLDAGPGAAGGGTLLSDAPA